MCPAEDRISFKRAISFLSLILCFLHGVDNFNIEVNKVGIANGEDNSQFGYSVAFIKAPGWRNVAREAFHEKMLLVGSPNKTLYNLHGHGQISSCSSLVTKNITCSWLNITDLSGKCNRLMQNRTSNCALDGRLGATIAVNRNFEKVFDNNDTLIPMISVCAPGWKNVLNENTEKIFHSYMIGMCLKLRDELTPVNCSSTYFSTSPINNYCWPFWPQYDTTSKTGRPVYTFAEAGMSAVFTLDGDLDIISAPGANDWRGAFHAGKTNWLVELTKENMHPTSYFGYSLAAGNFKIAIVAAGAPNYYQDQGHSGKVYLFARNKKVATEQIQFGETRPCNGKYIKVEQGKQYGTKFGASLAAIDINGDGVDELFVGAPLYSSLTKAEQGLVFVYTVTGYKLCGPIGILSGSGASYGRFGTSIANVGDLNKDNYNDIAIGAPYEGSGVVYIYHGVGAGNMVMPDKYVQHIDGESIKPGIKSFGWSIYGNEDIDNNRYNDLVVGAYLSNTLVVLRTRPIVQIDVNMTIFPSPLPLNSSKLECLTDNQQICFDVIVKFSWKPKDIKGNLNNINNITLLWTLNADTIYQVQKNSSRVLFRNTTKAIIQQQIFLDRHNRNGPSVTYTLDVQKYHNKSEPYDAWTKLQMEGTFVLVENFGDDFNALDPVLDNTAKTTFIEDVIFDKKCESLDQCISDLQLNVMLTLLINSQWTAVNNETVLYMDEAKDLQITIDVTNLHDSSYQAGFSSYVAATLKQFISSSAGVVGASCKHKNILSDMHLNCSADSKLDKNENFKILLMFDISRARLIPDNDLTKMLQTINITVTAKQANLDINMTNNMFQRSIDVKLKFNVSILENNEISDQVRYKANEGSTHTITLIHQYYLLNLGPSVLPQTYINISIPVAKGLEMIIADKRYPESCIVRSSVIPTEITTTDIELQITSTYKESSTLSTMRPPDAEQKKRETRTTFDGMPVVDASTIQPNIVNITCGDYQCEVIECKLKELNRNKQETIRIEIDVFEKAIAKQKNVREVHYATQAIVTDPFMWYGDKVVPWNKIVFAEKWTKFIVEPASVPSKINIWIFIGSVLGAVALLIIVIIVLWKCGFFKRRQHSEIQIWKKQSLYHSKITRHSVASKKDQQTYTPVEYDEKWH